MAKSGIELSIIPAIVFLSILLSPVAGYGGKVGGRTKISDVKTNNEVQELGKFCVEEFNKLSSSGGGPEGLKFSEVVEAETQIVSGVKYYMKIEANNGSLVKVFDSVVLVKPWLHSRHLVAFNPSFSPDSN
ncbi:Cysteine proteinase inhibitor 2 [Euphorbia peplus]|nr:Cysteine proteinase inhibitor 2 [Euphorbia peplus]